MHSEGDRTLQGVVLDAKPLERGMEVALATPEGVEWHRLAWVRYRVYLRPTGHYTAEEVAAGIEASCWDTITRVEEWLSPPNYDKPTKLAVIESSCPGELVAIAGRLESFGVARRVNKYPGMLTEALERHGLWPGYAVRISGGRAWILEDPEDPSYPGHGLRVAKVKAVAWHGPVVSPDDRPTHYVVVLEGREEKAETPEEV